MNGEKIDSNLKPDMKSSFTVIKTSHEASRCQPDFSGMYTYT